MHTHHMVVYECVCVGGTQGSVQLSKVGTIELSSLFEGHQIPICPGPRSCPTMLFCQVCPLQSVRQGWWIPILWYSFTGSHCQEN